MVKQSTAVSPLRVDTPPALLLKEEELLNVLRTSLYPGAKDESIKLVLSYCRASGLDPMTKPVHIVPMKVKVGEDARGKAEYAMRDTIMPGVGLYRTQASRTGECMGISEPEFGPTKTLEFSEEYWESNQKQSRSATLEYPEWCRITVRRLVGDREAEFTAVERWIENYATAGNYTKAPNAMWKRRSFAQLAKCTEAQALRKAFPELGSQPTAEELEGKDLDSVHAGTVIDGATGAVVEKKAVVAKPAYSDDAFKKNLPSWTKLVTDGKKTPEQIVATIESKATLTDEQKKQINELKPAA